MTTELPAPKLNPELAWASDNLLWDKDAVAQEVGGWLGRAMVAYYEVGRRLIWAKHMLGHGHFQDWISTHFGMSESTAQRFMEVARFFHAHPAAIDTLKSAGMRKMLVLSKTNDDLVAEILNGKVEGLTPADINSKAVSEADLKAKIAALERKLKDREEEAAAATSTASKAEERATVAVKEANTLRSQLVEVTSVRWTTEEEKVQESLNKLTTTITNGIHQCFSVLGAAVSRARDGELRMEVVAQVVALASHVQTLATLQELNVRASIGEAIPNESLQELYARYGMSLPPLLQPDQVVEPEPPRAPVPSALADSLRIKLRNAEESGNKHVSIRVEELAQLLNEVPVLEEEESDSSPGWGEAVPKDRGLPPNLRVVPAEPRDPRW